MNAVSARDMDMEQHLTILQLIGLGTVAGFFPVYLGIAVALFAVKVLDRAWERFLIGLSAGILIYLFFDVMHEAVELTSARDFLSWTILLGSFFVNFVGLVAIEQRGQRRNGSAMNPLFLPYMIALGMGLHNLGEGLAIGASYAQGQWALSGLLVGGFALAQRDRWIRHYGAGGPDSASFERHCPLGVARRWADLPGHSDR